MTRPQPARFAFAGTAVAAAIVLLVVVSGPLVPSATRGTIWINGEARSVPTYATVEHAMRVVPGDWPTATMYDIEGAAIATVEVTPTVRINGERVALDTPIPPYTRLNVSAVSEIAEPVVIDYELVPGDPPPRVWNQLWREPAPGKVAVRVGAVSGKRIVGEPVLRPRPAAFLGEQAVAALTFDDGPDPTWTGAILDVLKEKGVRATFFVLGARVQAYPDLVLRTVTEGHSIQNHSWNHPPNFGELPFDQVRDEMAGTSDVIQAVTGQRPTFFRPPGGGLSADVEAAAGELGMYITMWNVDPQDWAGRSAEEIYARVTQGLGGGDLILMHDGGGDGGQTAAALGAIIDDLRSKGFAFVTLG